MLNLISTLALAFPAVKQRGGGIPTNCQRQRRASFRRLPHIPAPRKAGFRPGPEHKRTKVLVSRPPTARKINMGCCVKQESTQKAPWGKQSSFYFVHRPHAKVRSGFESLLGQSKIQPKGMQIFFFKPQGSLHKKAFEHPNGGAARALM